MRNLSLRWLLLMPILLTIVVGFIAFAVAIDVGERSLRLSEIDQELGRAELNPLTPPTPGADADASGAPSAPSAAVPAHADSDLPVQLAVAEDGTIVGRQGGENPFSASTVAALATTPERSVVNIDGYRVLISPGPDGLVQMTALSLAGYDVAMAGLHRTLLLGGLAIAVLEGIMAWILARKLARPLRVVTESVTRIADGAHDTSINPAGGSQEIAKLSADIGRMVERLRAALAEREQSAADATRARDDMRRLLADVAHEIRTPLTALQGYSDLYGRDMLVAPGALDRAMARVGEESIRLNELVNSMLQLAREGSPAESVRVSVDLNTVVRNVVDDLRVAFPERRIETFLDAEHDATLCGDPGRLHQAVLNLGANACRHTPAETLISLELTVTTPVVTVRVVDHGPGIEDSEREEIFLPFYRSDPARARDNNVGAGLGLAVTLQIAREHGGSVALYPTPGGGATFELRVPLDDTADARDGTAVELTIGPRLGLSAEVGEN